MKFNEYEFSDFDLECLHAETLPEDDSEYFKQIWEEINNEKYDSEEFKIIYGGY